MNNGYTPFQNFLLEQFAKELKRQLMAKIKEEAEAQSKGTPLKTLVGEQTIIPEVCAN